MAQTESSNFASRSATSLKRTNSAPGTTGANGKRYFSVAVTLITPKVPPWNEFSRARERCFFAGGWGGFFGFSAKKRGGLLVAPPIFPSPVLKKKTRHSEHLAGCS